MNWAFENQRTHTLLADVLAALPLADQAVVRGRLTLATDDRKRALDAGGGVAYGLDNYQVHCCRLLRVRRGGIFARNHNVITCRLWWVGLYCQM